MTDEISYARVKSDVESAQSYSQRKQDKHEQEMAMLAKAFAKTKDVQKVLDAPCGVGRASIWLAQQGKQVTGIDLGEAALEGRRRRTIRVSGHLRPDLCRQGLRCHAVFPPTAPFRERGPAGAPDRRNMPCQRSLCGDVANLP